MCALRKQRKSRKHRVGVARGVEGHARVGRGSAESRCAMNHGTSPIESREPNIPQSSSACRCMCFSIRRRAAGAQPPRSISVPVTGCAATNEGLFCVRVRAAMMQSALPCVVCVLCVPSEKREN